MNIIEDTPYKKVIEELKRITVINPTAIKDHINKHLKGKTFDDMEWYCCDVNENGEVYLQYKDDAYDDFVDFDEDQPEQSEVYDWIDKFARDEKISLCVQISLPK